MSIKQFKQLEPAGEPGCRPDRIDDWSAVRRTDGVLGVYWATIREVGACLVALRPDERAKVAFATERSAAAKARRAYNPNRK